MSNLNDARTIDPDAKLIKLSSGLVVELQSLRMRQFFKLMRIVSHGAGGSLSNLSLSDNQEVFVVKLLTLTMLSIPDAEDETIEFLLSMVKPVGLIDRRNLNKQDKERNDELWAQVLDVLDNPDPEDFVTLIEAIVNNEAEDLQALGKRLASLMKLAQKTGQLPESLTSPDQTSSEESAEPTTSSPQSTDGPTEISVNLPSEESVNA